MQISDWLEHHAELDRAEREALLRHHLGVDRATIIRAPETLIEPCIRARLEQDARRLAAGEPLAYLTGEQGFWDFDLRVTPAVLIPRPETETLVEAALARLQPGDRVLDLGTGSGAIAIALARSAAVSVLAVDANLPALAVAQSNARRLQAPVQFLASDWFSAVSGTFHMIVANPPYVAEGDPHLVDLTFEPREALVSGPQGLDALEAIIRTAPDHLTQGGWLLLEHGYDQAAAVRRALASAGFTDIETQRDLGGQPRVTLGRWNATAA